MRCQGVSYRYDVFLSYRRSGYGNASQWVRNHFHPLLVNCLSDELDWEPRIFFDLEAETGSYWPSLLERALLHSKMLVAVWSPPYFRSAWCLAEWRSMLAREQLVTPDEPDGLVYPVVFSDSTSFPQAAVDRQSRDLKAWSNPFPSFRQSHDYHHFHRAMVDIAAELGRKLHKAPEWQPDWPVCRPDKPSRSQPDLAEL